MLYMCKSCSRLYDKAKMLQSALSIKGWQPQQFSPHCMNMDLMAILSVLFGIVGLISADSYDNYKVYDIAQVAQWQQDWLLNLSQHEQYDFFKLPRRLDVPARVMVAPEQQVHFEALLQSFAFNYTIIEQNLGKSLHEESLEGASARDEDNALISFNKFQRFEAINEYLEQLARNFPARVKINTLGESHERRAIKTITITNGDGVTNKKVILLDAGIHAREWIAPAAALYIIHQLVEQFETNAALLQNFDWVILPVVNPDGYEYTHTNKRMWRKTRKPMSTYCIGTDANRNFDFNWGLVGASANCASDTYKGPKAFSEPETQLLRNLMHELSGRAKFYLTLHSYGNYLLYPWGYTSELPDNWHEIDSVAKAGAAAIRAATNTEYTVGSSTNVLYAAAGGSDDYALAKAHIPISITMELPAGGTGFNPSTKQIKPFVRETWVGVRAMAEKVIAKYI